MRLSVGHCCRPIANLKQGRTPSHHHYCQGPAGPRWPDATNANAIESQTQSWDSESDSCTEDKRVMLKVGVRCSFASQATPQGRHQLARRVQVCSTCEHPLQCGQNLLGPGWVINCDYPEQKIEHFWEYSKDNHR